MPPSRRTVVGLIGTTTLTVLAGCARFDSGSVGGSGEGGTPTIGTGEGADFEVRLLGSETDRLLFDETGVAEVGAVQERNGRFLLPVTLTDAAARSVTDVFRTAGVAEDPGAFEIAHYHRGEEVSRLSITPGLAEAIAEGEWEGEFVLTFAEREPARELRATLVGG